MKASIHPKKILIGLFSLLIAAQVLYSCADGTDPSDTHDTADIIAPIGNDTAEDIPDGLPDTDMEGRAFRMLIQGDELFHAQIYIDRESGNIVDDAVYRKIRTVEERFNVDIVLTPESDTAEAGLADVRNMIIAGDDVFDILQGHDITMAEMAMQGYFINVYDIPHLDFTKPWWSDETVKSMMVSEQMYMMFNNISYNNLAVTRVFFFNKTMMNNLDIAYPYEDVYNGTWTLDSLYTLTSQGYHDLNGNGKTDEGDQFGFVNPKYGYYCLFEPFRVEPYQKDSDGNLIYKVDENKITVLTEKFYELLFTEGGFHANMDDSENLTYRCFTEDRAMFIYAGLQSAVTHLSHSEAVYGILPMPKYDETQTEYYSGSTDRPIAVPVTAVLRLGDIGLVAEALNAEGYKQVYPAYFEIAMKTRYADQTDDAKMLDLIRDNVIISFTYLYGNYASIYNLMLEELFNGAKPSTDVASWCAKYEKKQTKYVESLQEFFDENRP